MTSVLLAKHLMMEDEMEVLTWFQVESGFGFALQVLQVLCMRVMALITLVRLCVCTRRLVIRSWDWLTGMVMTLIDLVSESEVGRAVQATMGQEDLS